MRRDGASTENKKEKTQPQQNHKHCSVSPLQRDKVGSPSRPGPFVTVPCPETLGPGRGATACSASSKQSLGFHPFVIRSVSIHFRQR